MEIGEFRKQFMEQLRFDAEHEGSAPDPEALGKDEEAVEEVEGADGACDEERNSGIGLAEHAAHKFIG